MDTKHDIEDELDVGECENQEPCFYPRKWSIRSLDDKSDQQIPSLPPSVLLQRDMEFVEDHEEVDEDTAD
ncbi:hypothetical protein P9112_014266 [Eukaryota sp. TZLM1-RC]